VSERQSAVQIDGGHRGAHRHRGEGLDGVFDLIRGLDRFEETDIRSQISRGDELSNVILILHQIIIP